MLWVKLGYWVLFPPVAWGDLGLCLLLLLVCTGEAAGICRSRVSSEPHDVMFLANLP